MNKPLAFWSAISLGLLSGCGGTAPLVQMPNAPATTTEVISTTVKFADSKALEENVVQLATHVVKAGSSVVINVPAGLFDDDSEPDSDARNSDFKTKDFFNTAEQEIEMVFIRHGFRVLSRAKFEAKLRDLRDEARCDLNEYRCLRSQASPEVQPILDELKAKFDHKEITAPDYADQIKQFRDKLQTASAGKTRKGDEKELTDISEVIRAAQSGDTRADYILQINVFNTKKKINMALDIRQIPDVREFVREYPAIKNQLDDSRYNQLNCAVWGAELNAKLIHVKSGEIIWIGSHELNEFSSGVNQLAIELGQRTDVANKDKIQNFVDWQNTEMQREARYGKEIQLPAWEFKTQLEPVTVISGRCEKNWQYDDKTMAKLSAEVARGLISTIKVTSVQMATEEVSKTIPESTERAGGKKVRTAKVN